MLPNASHGGRRRQRRCSIGSAKRALCPVWWMPPRNRDRLRWDKRGPMNYARFRHAVAVATVMCALAVPAWAQSAASVGAITIRDAWARASTGQSGTSAVYMTLEASGDQGDRLI